MTHASDILLVDDDPDLLKLISFRLTSAKPPWRHWRSTARRP